MYTISKKFEFCASHCLDHLPPDHPCSRIHGHNYSVEVVLESDELDENGFVLDYRKLDIVKIKIDEKLDHQHLNNAMEGLKPTAELIAKMLYEWIYAAVICDETIRKDLKLSAVRVSETGKTWAEYRK